MTTARSATTTPTNEGGGAGPGDDAAADDMGGGSTSAATTTTGNAPNLIARGPPRERPPTGRPGARRMPMLSVLPTMTARPNPTPRIRLRPDRVGVAEGSTCARGMFMDARHDVQRRTRGTRRARCFLRVLRFLR